MSASMKSVRARSDRGRHAVDPGEVLDRRIALEPARQLRPPVARDAGDHDPATRPSLILSLRLRLGSGAGPPRREASSPLQRLEPRRAPPRARPAGAWRELGAPRPAPAWRAPRGRRRPSRATSSSSCGRALGVSAAEPARAGRPAATEGALDGRPSASATPRSPDVRGCASAAATPRSGPRAAGLAVAVAARQRRRRSAATSSIGSSKRSSSASSRSESERSRCSRRSRSAPEGCSGRPWRERWAWAARSPAPTALGERLAEERVLEQRLGELAQRLLAARPDARSRCSRSLIRDRPRDRPLQAHSAAQVTA